MYFVAMLRVVVDGRAESLSFPRDLDPSSSLAIGHGGTGVGGKSSNKSSGSGTEPLNHGRRLAHVSWPCGSKVVVALVPGDRLERCRRRRCFEVREELLARSSPLFGPRGGAMKDSGSPDRTSRKSSADSGEECGWRVVLRGAASGSEEVAAKKQSRDLALRDDVVHLVLLPAPLHHRRCAPSKQLALKWGSVHENARCSPSTGTPYERKAMDLMPADDRTDRCVPTLFETRSRLGLVGLLVAELRGRKRCWQPRWEWSCCWGMRWCSAPRRRQLPTSARCSG